MHVKRLTVGDFQANCYIVFDDDGRCVVIDPGGEPERIISTLQRKELAPRYVVNTHAHIDHIRGNAELLAEFPDSELACGRSAAGRLTSSLANLSAVFLRPFESPEATVILNDGDVLEAGGVALKTLETPGHSPGSICLLAEGLEGPLFSGDTLFQSGVGRTDLPGGDMDALVESIRNRLYALPETVVVHPGHGPSTTIGQERASNPFVRP